MKRVILLLFLVISIGLTGCSSTRHMQVATPEQVTSYNTINPDESVVVFYRPSGFYGAAMAPYIIDSDDDGNLKFVSVIPSGSKFFYRTNPGKHGFFITGYSMFGPWAGPMLEAELQPGKIYYVEYSPWLNLIRLEPINAVKTKEDIKKDLNSCQWLENTDAGSAWFESATVALKERSQKAADMGEAVRERRKEDLEKKMKDDPEQYEKDKEKGKDQEFRLKSEYGLDAPI